MAVSEIVTERLILVPFSLEFTDSSPEIRKEALVKAGLKPDGGWPPEDTVEILPKVRARLEKPGEQEGFFSWLFVRKEDREVIGDGGFKNSPGENGEVEIGYGILETERRKGYCSEAIQALTRWAFSFENVKAVIADCLTDNDGSAGVLVKCGFHETGMSDGLRHWKLEKQEAFLADCETK